MAVRYRKIRNVVGQLLEKHGISDAPIDVESLLIAYDIELLTPPADDDLSGFITRDEETGKIFIGVNETHNVNRKRFTMAHELGHLLLHIGFDHHVDQKTSEHTPMQWRYRNATSSEGTDEEEREANRFAAELLMPTSFLVSAINKIGDIDFLDDNKVIEDLAKQFQVSHAAMSIRLSQVLPQISF